MARKKTNGYLASISMQDGSQMECRLQKWAPGDIKVCINCSLVPSKLFNLQCSHKLCQKCFYNESCYVCPMDNTKSVRYQVTPLITFNSGLIKTTLECPLCYTVVEYLKLEEHFKRSHPEISNKMQPSSHEKKLSERPRTIGPPPGFEGHVSPLGRAEVDHISNAQTSKPCEKTEPQAEEINLCPNCSALLKFEDIAGHAENCPKLLVCENCSSRVIAKHYGKHLDGQCPANKQACTSTQVNYDTGKKPSTKSVAHEKKYRAHDMGGGSSPCPYCQTLWDNKDLQEHMKSCQKDPFQPLNLPSGKTDHQKPVDASFQNRKPDTVFYKKTDKDNERPKEEEDEVEALKQRVEELEKRIENLERPLTRLIERLRSAE